MKKLGLLAALLVGLAPVCRAQDGVAEVVKRMIRKYPAAVHRMEYRCTPDSGKRTFREVRYDFRMRRDAMQASDVRALKDVCDKAWKAASPKTDRMMKYAYGDSLCSTLVYRVKQPLRSNLLRHDAPQAFWGNDGFLLFDLGEYVSVVLDKVERPAETPRGADFAPLNSALAQLCRGRSVDETPVRYTGHVGSFVFQRRNGNGWTRGVRHTVQGVDEADFGRLREAFMRYWESGEAVNLIVRNREIMMKSESGPDFFIASFNPARTLHFLTATVEDEICVPTGWETMDFFNNGLTDYVDVSRLDALYDSLAARPEAVAVDVCYTGSFVCGHRGFAWQRGWGSGWTRGKRIEIRQLTAAEREHILNTFRSYVGVLGHVNLQERGTTTYEEGTRTFYGFATEADGRAFFLKATTEGEICIPYDWTTSNYFKGSEPGYADRLPPSTKRVYGLSRLWAGAKENFVFMERVKVDWDSLYASLIPRMAEAKDDCEALRLLQGMAARLGDGHTYVADAGGNLVAAPLRTKYIGGRVYIDKVYSSLLDRQGIRRGQELTAVNGMPVGAYVKKYVEPYAASSTPQWLEYLCYESEALLQRKAGEPLRLTLKAGDCTFEVAFTAGAVRWDKNESRPDLSFSVLEDNIGYLRIASFGNTAVRAQFDTVYADLLRTRALIIDLRGNGGGNSGNSDHILRHFSADTMRTSSWRSPIYIPAFASWGYARGWHEVPSGRLSPISGKPVYDKPVVLLVDNATFSAAEDFCSVFRGMRRGPLVGRPTGGSTGNGVRFELIPGVAWANICAKHDRAADGTEFVGTGFVPDVPVEETYESWFVRERDNGLAEAVRLLSGRSRLHK